MKIFISGHKGQLGRALLESLSDHELHTGDLPEWNMTDYDQVMTTLQDVRPDVVLHSAALTNVDYCANNPEEAVRINGVGTYNVAVASESVGATLLAISTNEVFDGEGERPYQEYDQRNPINPYGYSKTVAEQVVERYCSRYMIVRTAWLYASGGVNFIHKVVARAREGQPLRVVTDEVGSPTYANDLAEAISKLIMLERPGIYHMVNEGICSRWEFAREILDLAGFKDTPIEKITSDAFDRASTPPPYAPLANIFGSAHGVTMRTWREALAEFVSQHVTEEQA